MASSTLDPVAGFAQSYAEARGKFLAAADAAGLDVHHHGHPMLGRDGEALALDVVRDGPADAPAVLVLSSACHGVEGYCGSGAQVALLGDVALRRAARQAGVALLYLHGLNPYGFSWWRRTTHENVDLNRNFVDFSQPLPHNADYDALAHLIVPPHWPPSAEVQAAVQRFIDERGAKAWQAALSTGQHEHPEGLFFAGRNPTWSQVAVRHVLADEARHCQRLGWIDFHTGLGPSGHGERIYAGRDDAATLARAKAWWGQGVTSIYDGSSTSARITGMMWMAAYEECPQAEFTGIALEYGTLPMGEVLDALRADQWLENHPNHPDAEAQAAGIKRRMRDAFYTDTPEWKRRIVEQAFDAVREGVAGLAGR